MLDEVLLGRQHFAIQGSVLPVLARPKGPTEPISAQTFGLETQYVEKDSVNINIKMQPWFDGTPCGKRWLKFKNFNYTLRQALPFPLSSFVGLGVSGS